jgi:hypothetical protein
MLLLLLCFTGTGCDFIFLFCIFSLGDIQGRASDSVLHAQSDAKAYIGEAVRKISGIWKSFTGQKLGTRTKGATEGSSHSK